MLTLEKLAQQLNELATLLESDEPINRAKAVGTLRAGAEYCEQYANEVARMRAKVKRVANAALGRSTNA